MIENERHYRITRAQLARLEKALQSTARATEALPPRLRNLPVEALTSQIDDLKRELREYEDLKAGRFPHLLLNGISQLGEILIKARLARGYTQAELADRLALRAQQIQKYETKRYEPASLRRIVDVMTALGIDLQAKISLWNSSAPKSGSVSAQDVDAANDPGRGHHPEPRDIPPISHRLCDEAASIVRARGLWSTAA